MPPGSTSLIFIELGAAIIAMAMLARISSRFGLSPIPLYLISGLAVGTGGLVPLQLSKQFIQIGAEIGVLLLLFMLGLEYSGAQLQENLRKGLPGGVLDFLLNFPIGFVAGLALGWKILPSVLLGGITYISSSGIIAKLLSELGRTNSAETPTVLSILVLEDLAMAVYLPLVAVLLSGGGTHKIVTAISIATTTVLTVLFLAIRYGRSLSRFVAHQSDEIILLTTFGTVLLVAGLAEELQVSAAIGAFLIGIAVSGPLAKQSERMLSPLRDLFAALFFFFFGLQTDPRTLPAVALPALLLAVITVIGKVATGWIAARQSKLKSAAGLRAGITLVAHGEFSIVIAGLGTTLEPRLGALAAAYVMILAVAGPVLVRIIKPKDEERVESASPTLASRPKHIA